MESDLSKHFRETRIAQGIRVSHLAHLCGYRNISRGSRRIHNFEAGGSIHRPLLLKLADVLKIDRAKVEALVEEDRRQFFAEWNEWANEPIRPYVVVRMMPAIYCPHDLPEEIQSVKEAEQYTADFSKKNRLKCCLVLSRKISVWFSHDGCIENVTEAVPGQPNVPHAVIGGRKCVTKFVDHQIAIQQVNWPNKQEITGEPEAQEVVTDFGGGVRMRSSFEVVEDEPGQVTFNVEGPSLEFGEAPDSERYRDLDFNYAVWLVLWQHNVSLPDDEIKALVTGLDCEAIKQHASHLKNPFDYIPAMHSEIEDYLLQRGVLKGEKKL